MSDIQLYLLEFDKNKTEASNIAKQSADRLQKNELKLLGLIEQLQEYINNDDPAIREKTLSYLAEVLAFSPQKFLSLQQRNLLCDFVLSRITDSQEGIAPCSKALLALEDRGRWDEERAANIMETFLSHTHPLRQYSQPQRYPVLQLIDRLMAKYRDALRRLHETNPDFLSRFISYYDGEKDPRNLMMVFSLLKVPMTEWEVGGDAQELFDAVFNYFPITFRPPPNDPYGITAQDLKDRLRDCISSTAYFAPYSFPGLLDKLDSTSMNTKRDALQAITACVREYGPRTISLYSITLWDSLKYEILNSQEDDLANEALTGLAEIATTLSQGTDGPLNAYLKPIIKECNEHLEDAPTKQSQSSGQILHKIVTVSPRVANIVIPPVLRNIFTLYQSAETATKRRGLLEALGQLLRANLGVYGEWHSMKATGDKASSNTLAEFKDQALELLCHGLSTASVTEVSFRLLCLNGLLVMSKIRQLLSDQDIAKVIQLLHSVVIKEESYGKDELKTAADDALVGIAHQKPQIVVDSAFPAFLAELPDTDADNTVHYMPVLEAFAKLGSEEKIFDTVILRLKNKLNSAVQHQASSTYINALLSAMLYALLRSSSKLEQSPDSAPYFQDIVLPLLRQASSSEATQKRAFDNERTLDLIGRICNLIIRPQSVKQQNDTIAEEMYYVLRDHNKEIPPINLDATPDETRFMILSTYLLASLHKEATLPDETNPLLSSLIKFSQLSNLSEHVRTTTLDQITLLINKFIPTASLKPTVEPILQPLLDFSNLNATNISITFAILKALVLRNSPLLNSTYPSLLSLLSHPELGKTVAHGFSTLLQPSDLLTKQNHCQISGLYKQKTFALLVPNITTSFKEATKEAKPNYLIALSGILRWMPFHIIVEEVAPLVPLLLQSLDLAGEDGVKEAAIDTMTHILQERPKEVEEHLGSLITRLLNATTYSSDTLYYNARRTASSAPAKSEPARSNPPKVRADALRALTLVAQRLPQEKVLPYSRTVSKRLLVSLDDRKRGVRAEAVRCRGKWLAVGEGEEE